MHTKIKWEKRDKGWLLLGTQFSLYRDHNGWDVAEGDYYLCNTRYVGVAKNICERLAASPQK